MQMKPVERGVVQSGMTHKAESVSYVGLRNLHQGGESCYESDIWFRVAAVINLRAIPTCKIGAISFRIDALQNFCMEILKTRAKLRLLSAISPIRDVFSRGRSGEVSGGAGFSTKSGKCRVRRARNGA